VITFASYLSKAYASPGEEQRSYTVYLLCSLSHTATLYCTAILVESDNFLAVKPAKMVVHCESVTEARTCSLVKPDDISYGVVMDECEAMVK
jgi:hypothetical protein